MYLKRINLFASTISIPAVPKSRRLLVFASLCCGMVSGIFSTASLADTPAKSSINLPPSATLEYTIKAKQSGITLSGDASVMWKTGNQRYSIITETRAMLIGKILDVSSVGGVDSYGLAPEKFNEKRLGKPETITNFNRKGDKKSITFSESAERYPIKGGEQDRSSATWQLVGLARAAGDKFKPGSEWKMFVAGRRDAETWSFKVMQRETLATGMGNLMTVHVVKLPPPNSKSQHIDLWLAPALEWYPVRVLFSDVDGDYIEQLIGQIKK
ncbi:DUF3108 domain-containing protein [Undibacterium sp. RTI2.1]|uniref:DUF3108 domain-containing protein n=1 Tax=unclassified Undibacterium TaxID=2630295 RepID=UPI002AB358C6|nr:MULTISPECIES: DUF3108 domain-containing protein [unclassified Undibacterium]MDY7540067.1 DUF3108 domain-containing protein [Undibacterium sp. 5I1]MEB0031607.1 DUF3108 domain-containing protein [Undibacterium sp. RTI2.1]MEB0117822.1 DUF3108 domain-containing protein [Undibacterium sp. RTI2.2]MEB0232945.1 DUF3108 domain-containing protein [Undibacterium sp. 10I3]MEB0257914.1 DUF3108 domain-containing protein [Undibacterium sp. 5I1]